VTDQAIIAAADEISRHWAAPEAGSIQPGSEQHKSLFCRMLLDTHNPYKPAVIDWPRLDREARDRLVSLPIWDIAVQTEGKARLRMQRYAASLPDAEWREALELNRGFDVVVHQNRSGSVVNSSVDGENELGHKRLMSKNYNTLVISLPTREVPSTRCRQ